MTSGSTVWTYTYDANGMRTSRSNGNLGYTYVYNGGSLSKMTYTGLNSATLYFSYDASGRPLSVSYTDANETTTTYYYITNLQGDVLAIVDGTGTAVVQYIYDAWGRQLSMTGTMKWTLGMQNPLRYRGYVYDSETSLYYLQSRYYNPEIGRFLNADAFVATGQGELGNNMFAYCLNNPVILEDTTGSAARSCITAADGIDETPWRDHSPGGGGIPRRNYSSGSNYYGEVADKFYAVKFFRAVGKGLDTGAEWLWDAYMRGFNIQQETQFQYTLAQHELYKDVYDYITDDGFWSTDAGIVVQSTIVGAGFGAATGFASSISPALALLPISPQAALVTVVSATVTGFIKGAASGFACGIATIAIW